MRALLDELLDVSRLTYGGLMLERQHVPLQELLDAALEVAQPLIAARRHLLHLEPLSPAPVLDVDPVRFTQVISNLLTNAVKYKDPGGDLTLGCRVDVDRMRTSSPPDRREASTTISRSPSIPRRSSRS